MSIKKSKNAIAKEWIEKYPNLNFLELQEKGMPKTVKKQNVYDTRAQLKRKISSSGRSSSRKGQYKNNVYVEAIEKYVKENDITTYKDFVAQTGINCGTGMFQYHRKRVLKELGKASSTNTIKENALTQFLFEIPTDGKSEEEEQTIKEAMDKLASAKGTKVYIRELRNPNAIGVWSLKN